jgi:hypothetical protein
MQTKRIEYIDALRGFTMFLVVLNGSFLEETVVRRVSEME